MTIYLDTSVLIALFVADDALAARARAFGTRALGTRALGTDGENRLVVSTFAGTEFGAIIARLRRMSRNFDAHAVLSLFDTWHAEFIEQEETRDLDVQAASRMMRRPDLNLRAPDAIHLAIAQRIGAAVATFDAGMIANAAILGIAIAAG